MSRPCWVTVYHYSPPSHPFLSSLISSLPFLLRNARFPYRRSHLSPLHFITLQRTDCTHSCGFQHIVALIPPPCHSYYGLPCLNSTFDGYHSISTRPIISMSMPFPLLQPCFLYLCLFTHEPGSITHILYAINQTLVSVLKLPCTFMLSFSPSPFIRFVLYSRRVSSISQSSIPPNHPTQHPSFFTPLSNCPIFLSCFTLPTPPPIVLVFLYMSPSSLPPGFSSLPPCHVLQIQIVNTSM